MDNLSKVFVQNTENICELVYFQIIQVYFETKNSQLTLFVSA